MGETPTIETIAMDRKKPERGVRKPVPATRQPSAAKPTKDLLPGKPRLRLQRVHDGFPYFDDGLALDKVFIESYVEGWRVYKSQITKLINDSVASFGDKSIDVTALHIWLYDREMQFYFTFKDKDFQKRLYFVLDDGTFSKRNDITTSRLISGMTKPHKTAVSEAFNATEKRWAENRRPKQQVKLRLDPSLIEEVEQAAEESGLNRTDWITQVIQKALRHDR